MRNYLYLLPMIPGKIPGTPAATGNSLEINPGGRTIYDPVANVTWLADANIAASNTFGLPLCTGPASQVACVNSDGALTWDSAVQLVSNMNSTAYLGQTNWELPPIDANCVGLNCGSSTNPLGELYYAQLNLKAGDSVVPVSHTLVGPFKNIQPYLYWACLAPTVQSPCDPTGPAPNFQWSFSFGNGFEGTDLLQNDLYATAYFVGPRATSLTPVISSVQDAESARTTLVPGAWSAIYGMNLAAPGTPCAGATIRIWCAPQDFPGGIAVGSPLPTNLDGTSVSFNGQPAAIYYILSTQIGLQVPALSPGSASVVVTTNGVSSAPFTVNIVPSAPSFFINPVGGVTYPAAVHNVQPITYVGDPAIAGGAYQKAHPGEVIILYVNGLTSSPAGQVVGTGPDLSPGVTVMAGTTPLNVFFAGLVAPGEFQLNVTIPPTLAPGNYPLTVSYQGNSSPAGVTLPVGP